MYNVTFTALWKTSSPLPWIHLAYRLTGRSTVILNHLLLNTQHNLGNISSTRQKGAKARRGCTSVKTSVNLLTSQIAAFDAAAHLDLYPWSPIAFYSAIRSFYEWVHRSFYLLMNVNQRITLVQCNWNFTCHYLDFNPLCAFKLNPFGDRTNIKIILKCNKSPVMFYRSPSNCCNGSKYIHWHVVVHTLRKLNCL